MEVICSYSSAAKTELQKLDSIQSSALRLLLGARRSTPILSLQAESGIHPLSVHRDYLNIKQMIKLRNKPELFETTKTINLDQQRINADKLTLKSFSSRTLNSLQRYDIPTIKRVYTCSSLWPPWNTVSNLIKTEFSERVYNNQTFLNYTEEQYSDFTILFTDGSKQKESARYSAAAGLYSPLHNLSICWKLRPEHSVISTELYAISKALQFSLDNNMSKVVIFSDSMSALQLICSPRNSYINIVSKIKRLLISLNQQKTVHLHWVKAHCGINGNEMADKTANKGHANDRSEKYDLCELEYYSILKEKVQIYCTNHWKQQTIESGKGLFLTTVRDKVASSKLVVDLPSRRHQVVIHRLRMGHAGVKQYLYRFGMGDSGECVQCQSSETIHHYLLECSCSAVQRDLMIISLRQVGISNPTLKILLGGDESFADSRRKIFEILIQYIKDTNKLSAL